MKSTIYTLVYSSYTQSDGYLYTECHTYTDETEARSDLENHIKNAYKECLLGECWDEAPDLADFTDEDHDKYSPYEVIDMKDGDKYTFNSDAYEGYTVNIMLEKQEIEI